MLRNLCLAALSAAVLAATPARAEAPPEAPAPVVEAVRAMVEGRLAASAGPSAEAYKALLTRTEEPAYSTVDEAGRLVERPDDGADHIPIADELKFRGRVEDLRVRLYGETAVATYRVVIELEFNGEPCTKVFRTTEVFHRSGGVWRSVARQDTVAPGRPVYRATIEPATLDAFVGDYRLSPSVTYQVRRRGDRLYFGAGEDAVELVPESATTFVFDDDSDYRVIFKRDAAGKVTAFRMREFTGVEYDAVRIDGR